MTTKIIIKNENGPEIVLVEKDGRTKALLPEQEEEFYICFDSNLYISEADYYVNESISKPTYEK